MFCDIKRALLTTPIVQWIFGCWTWKQPYASFSRLHHDAVSFQIAFLPTYFLSKLFYTQLNIQILTVQVNEFDKCTQCGTNITIKTYNIIITPNAEWCWVCAESYFCWESEMLTSCSYPQTQINILSAFNTFFPLVDEEHFAWPRWFF